MNTSKVEICGVNTALLPVLNEEQKTQLLLAAKAGNSEARAQMIQGNLRLVLSVVQKFAGRGENLDDLFQVGSPHPHRNLGLGGVHLALGRNMT